MSNSLFGGSVATAGALLLAALTFYAHTSVAEPVASTPQAPPQQPKTTQNPTAIVAIAAEPLLTASAPTVAPPAFPKINTDADPPPPYNKTRAATQTFTATAYALHGWTASGQRTCRGLIAADRKVLPLGTRVRLEAGAYTGEYLVADRGSSVRGRRIDIWMPSNGEAMRFGRRPVKLTILTYGAERGASQATARARKAQR